MESGTYVTYDGTNLLKAGTVIPISGGGGTSASDNRIGGITTTSTSTSDNGLGGIAA